MRPLEAGEENSMNTVKGRSTHSRSPRVLVVQNSPTSGLGRLGDWLSSEGLIVELVAGATMPPALQGYHGVVLLGGGFMPDADGSHPWLPDERQLVQEALIHQVPLLGICLGEQVLAHVAGGEVTESSGETERGSVAIQLLPSAASDPLFSAMEDQELKMIENHKDSVTALPPEAVLLASSEACSIQAFRVGSCAWGIQFHPEVGAERLRTWDEASLAQQGVDKETLAQQAEEDDPQNKRQSQAFARSFAALVTQFAQRQGDAR